MGTPHHSNGIQYYLFPGRTIFCHLPTCDANQSFNMVAKSGSLWNRDWIQSAIVHSVVCIDVRSFTGFINPHLRLLHEQCHENDDESRIKASSCVCPPPIFTCGEKTTGERREEGRENKTKCPRVNLKNIN